MASNEQFLAQATAEFNAIDADKDGYLTKQELINFLDAKGLPFPFIAQCPIEKTSLKDFLFLYEGATAYQGIFTPWVAYNWMARSFILEHHSAHAAPGGGKRENYLKISAASDKHSKDDPLSKVGIEFGIDRQKQQAKIDHLAEVLKRKPHEVFLLLKFEVKSNKEEIRSKLETLFNILVSLPAQFAPEFQELASSIKSSVVCDEKYIYVVIEIANSFVDRSVSFFTELIMTISPSFDLTFRAEFEGHIRDMLHPEHQITKSSYNAKFELDIDTITQDRLRDMLAKQYLKTFSPHQDKESFFALLFALLFEYLHAELNFNNVGNAVENITGQEVSTIPNASLIIPGIKEMGIKENLEQIVPDSGAILDLIKDNCVCEGEVSINFRDLFFRLDFNVDVKGFFDLL